MSKVPQLACEAVTLLFFVLAPATAQAWSCADKADGQWCHNNEIWICDNGEAVFTDPCLYGCNEGAGPNGTCYPPPCSGFCCGKSNGKYCNGSTLITCTSQSTTNTKSCSFGCVSAGSNSSCAPAPCSGYCCGKADGQWCHLGDIWICDNEEDVFVDDCLWNCDEGDGPNAVCSPKPCSGYCCGKADGQWCHLGDIWICDNEADVFVDDCLWSCDEGDGPNASCSPKPCEGYCCGKEDGEWCHLDDILICVQEEDLFADPCLGGCVEGEGPDADCLPPPGFCKDRPDGIWCDGDTLRTCQGGVVTTWSPCLLTCIDDGPSATCSEAGFCVGKLNGWWCHDPSGHLLDCDDGAAVDIQECDVHCLSMELGEPDICGEPDPNKPPDWFCENIDQDTDSCWDDVLVTCEGGVAAVWNPCPAGCQINWPDTPDACAELIVDPQYCADKDWYWCYEDAAVVWCSGGIVAAVEECMNGCGEQRENIPDLCVPEDPEFFCTHHGEGAWCNGLFQIVTCNPDGSLQSAFDCDAGCVKAAYGTDDYCPGLENCGAPLAGSPISVSLDADCCPVLQGSTVLDVPNFNQTQYGGKKMGNCTSEKKSFKNFACLITSLSMYFEYAGVHRTKADGTEMANNPLNEDQWRKDNNGYIQCFGDKSCCMGYGTWFPANKNPPGFGGIGETENFPVDIDDPETEEKESCLLSPMVAKVIAAELNSGSPLVAHVDGSQTEEHYLLIVGVQNGQLLINDPGHGVKAGGFSSSSGYGPYDNIYSVYYRGAIGNGGGIPPWYEEPIPPDGYGENLTGGTVLTAEGEAALAEFVQQEIRADDAGGGSGCAAGPGPAGAAALLLLLVLSLAGCCVRRRHGGRH